MYTCIYDQMYGVIASVFGYVCFVYVCVCLTTCTIHPFTFNSSLGRSLLPLWYLPALIKVHRPLLKILLSSQQLKKCCLKCIRGSTSLRR